MSTHAGTRTRFFVLFGGTRDWEAKLNGCCVAIARGSERSPFGIDGDTDCGGVAVGDALRRNLEKVNGTTRRSI